MTSSRIAVKTLFFINGFMQANLVARIPRLMETHLMDNKVLGVALFCLALAAIMAMPFTGWLAARFGEKRIGTIVAVGYCSIFAFVPLMPDIRSIIVIFYLLGFLAGAVNVCINAQAISVERAIGKPILTSFHAVFSIGMFSGGVTGSWFISINYSIFQHLVLLAAFCVLCVLIAAKFNNTESTGKPFEKIFRVPDNSLWFIGVIIFCCVVGESIMSEWSTNYMVSIARASEEVAPWGLSAFAAAMTIGRLFGDNLRRKISDGNIIIMSSMVAAAGLLLATLVPQVSAVIAGFFLVGLGLSVIIPVAYSMAASTSDLPPSISVAMVASIGYTGFLLASPLVGFLADWQSLRFALAAIASVYLVLPLIFTLSGRRQSRTKTST